MNFGSLIWFGLVLICPISMMFMMRGMGGGMSRGMHGGEDAKDLRLAGLEREVAKLRSAQNERHFVELHKPAKS